MAVKHTYTTFLEKAHAAHGHKYDYSEVDWAKYTTSSTKITIVCLVHGKFIQSVDRHINNKLGCPKCSGSHISLQAFIKKAHAVHGDKYDYSDVRWTPETRSVSKINIVCPTHGVFTQSVSAHTVGRNGCPSCSNKQRYTLTSFLEKARSVHGEKYDYSSVTWTTETLGQSKVPIHCHIHGEFIQSVDNHINTQTGCPTCAAKSHTIDSFVKSARVAHGDKYDYSRVDWASVTNNRSKVLIICPIHGSFKQSVSGHINHKHGCKICKSSKGEIAVGRLLDQHGVAYVREHKFQMCKNPKTKKHLRFDFWLPEHNTCIEFHGEQHYSPVLFGHKNIVDFQARNTLALEQLAKIQHRDSVKEQYCKQNNIQLIIIPYVEKNKIADLLATIIERILNAIP